MVSKAKANKKSGAAANQKNKEKPAQQKGETKRVVWEFGSASDMGPTGPVRDTGVRIRLAETNSLET